MAPARRETCVNCGLITPVSEMFQSPSTGVLYCLRGTCGDPEAARNARDPNTVEDQAGRDALLAATANLERQDERERLFREYVFLEAELSEAAVFGRPLVPARERAVHRRRGEILAAIEELA